MKIIKLLFVGLLLFTLTAFIFVACGEEVAAGPEKITLKLAHVQSPNCPYGRGTQRFAELVNKYTNGNVEIKIYPSSQLGNNQEILNSIRIGSIEMALIPFPLLSDIVPEYTIYTAGFFYDSWEDLSIIIQHPEYGRKWDQELFQKGDLKIVATVYYGERNLTTTDTPIYRPDDLKGMKIRAVPNKASLAVVSGMGANPTPVPFAELYQALIQGVIDGQENPLPTIWAQKFYEVQHCLIMTRHQVIPLNWVISKKAWNDLTPQQQENVMKAGREAAAFLTQETKKEEATVIERLKEHGMTVITEKEGLDREAFKERVRADVIGRFAGKEWPEGLAEEILSIVDK